MGQKRVYHQQTKSSFPSSLHYIRRVKFDHLDKAFCIMKFAAVGLEHGSEETREGQAGETPAPLIRRVDLIVSPPEQYPFALVSWTGSKVSY